MNIIPCYGMIRGLWFLVQQVSMWSLGNGSFGTSCILMVPWQGTKPGEWFVVSLNKLALIMGRPLVPLSSLQQSESSSALPHLHLGPCINWTSRTHSCMVILKRPYTAISLQGLLTLLNPLMFVAFISPFMV